MKQKALTAHPRMPGAVLWFTGLSGSGKSTIACRVARAIKQRGLPVEYLDGDRMRAAFPQTGFTHEERDLHIRRIGYMAGLLERHGVYVVAAFISPYADSRAFVRKQCHRFLEIYVATPLAECERRDVKGLYARARRGKIRHFTGLDDPYEPPTRPALRLDTTDISIKTAVEKVLQRLDSKLGNRKPA